MFGTGFYFIWFQNIHRDFSLGGPNGGVFNIVSDIFINNIVKLNLNSSHVITATFTFPWERYENPYPPSYGLISATTIFTRMTLTLNNRKKIDMLLKPKKQKDLSDLKEIQSEWSRLFDEEKCWPNRNELREVRDFFQAVFPYNVNVFYCIEAFTRACFVSIFLWFFNENFNLLISI